MISTVAAMPLPEAMTTLSATADPASDLATPLQSPDLNLSGAKDESRLPIEPANGSAAAASAPVKPGGAIEPKPVPELSQAEFCSTLAASAEKHNVPVPLFANLIWQESRFRPQAVSPVGALGVAQFMPRVAQEVGLKNPFNPLEALPAAARFFAGLLDRFGSLGLATAAYNAGSGRVGNWLAKRTKVLPKETQNYVRVITGQPVDHWRAQKAHGRIALAAAMPCRNEAVFAKFNQADLPEHRQVVEQSQPLPRLLHIALRKSQAAPAAKTRQAVLTARAILAERAKRIVLVAKVIAKPHIAAVHGKKAAPVASRMAGGRDVRIKVASRR